MDNDFSFLIFIFMIISAGVGGVIGILKGRLAFGIILGFLLGPIGWLVTSCFSDASRKCPACLGRVPEGASKCRHCGSDLPLGGF